MSQDAIWYFLRCRFRLAGLAGILAFCLIDICFLKSLCEKTKSIFHSMRLSLQHRIVDSFSDISVSISKIP